MSEEIDFDQLIANLIMLIGDTVIQKKRPIASLSSIGAIIGARDDEMASTLLEDLVGRHEVKVGNITKLRAGTIFSEVDLTPDGWKRYYAANAESDPESEA